MILELLDGVEVPKASSTQENAFFWKHVANFHTPISFLKLSQAGFKYSGHGLGIVCEHCHKSHSLISLSNDLSPSSLDFHNFGCSQIENDIVTTNVASGAVSDIPESDGTQVEPRKNVSENIAKGIATASGQTEVTSCTPLNERNINLAQERGLVERISTRELTDQEISETEPSYSGLSTPPAAPSEIDYSNQMARRESFNSWSGQCPFNPGDLSLFYYFIGPDFCLKCWQCKIVIHINGDEEDLPRLRLELNEGRPICCLCYHRLPRLSSQCVVSQDNDRREDEDLSEEI
ncbi:E3 ubiquitin-protein ligase XIAP [Biomphalaria pfeifferi]|uniref:E3 ubiquitin-protein ligase XIAP n=1 Tax=Biomphalaria pfeifferi TaxID=112525 RepID=A0AAD8C148_BIOPF|nr:E3 ubiquitin-protein ligase XIAP [Biomphalaria pfeifferi]